MATMTARELKNATGEALRRVRGGEEIVITRRGRPVAVLSPLQEAAKGEPPTDPERFWQEIEQTLKSTEPPFETWKEAVRWSRRRS